MKDVWNKYEYIIDPHTSVAFNGCKEFIKLDPENNEKYFFVIVSTAHPSKFG